MDRVFENIITTLLDLTTHGSYFAKFGTGAEDYVLDPDVSTRSAAACPPGVQQDCLHIRFSCARPAKKKLPARDGHDLDLSFCHTVVPAWTIPCKLLAHLLGDKSRDTNEPQMRLGYWIEEQVK
jgi:hypothetical protein